MAGKKIGLFFGSFNPVHNGHMIIANYMAEYCDLEQVWFVISPLNPFKTEAEMLPDYQRRELLTRAVGDYQKFKVSSVEFGLPKPSYTIDTLTYLAKKYPENQFILIMGSDQLPDFHKWKKSEEILLNYKILIYPRTSVTSSLVTGRTSDYHPSMTLVPAPLMEISSSFIRNSIKDGKDVRFFMPELTWQYIEEMHFYSR